MGRWQAAGAAGQIANGVVVIMIDAVALLLLSEWLPGFVLDGPLAALGTALAIGILNAAAWPFLARATVRLSVLTLGLWTLVLNSVLVAAGIWLVPGAELHTPFEAAIVMILVTAVTMAISALLALDQDDSWYRNVVLYALRRREDEIESDVAGVIFCEIDGLGHDVLRRALANGSAPALNRWVRNGTHSLRGWETELSSQTGACQAGILHGSNHDMPAFRWWDKELGRPIVTNHPKDAARLEAKHSDGTGLLRGDGASRANILSGDAPHSLLTMSTVLDRRGKLGHDYGAYFSRPYAVARTAIATVLDVLAERRARRKQIRGDVVPRIERTWTYALVRAWATVIQLDLQVATVVADLLQGRPVIYTTFLAYDEVAHHSGIERPDTLAVLHQVDRQINRIQQAVADAPRPYEIVVLSDHGQSQGMTFVQRYGESLEDLVRASIGISTVAEQQEAASLEGEGSEDGEAAAYLRASLAESGIDRSPAGRRIAGKSRVPMDDDEQDYDGRDGEEGSSLPEVSVMASGCLGLVSFPRVPGRVVLETIEEAYPELIPALRSHPGIGFVLARSERYGEVVLGSDGVNQLEYGRVEGIDPLEPYGPNAAAHVLRTARFANCPDVLVNSRYWPDLDEVAAFEPLVGSHGGLGGAQSHPFVLHPKGWEWPGEPVVGSEEIYRIFNGWLAGLGMPGYQGGQDVQGGRESGDLKRA